MAIFFSSCNKTDDELLDPNPEYEIVEKRTFHQVITDISLDENGNRMVIHYFYNLNFQ
ncbi:MAG: hypothetical protein K8R74_16970 [Bacteroidales bacterium]|nr:hypothetical protein [Bacteroidales bacterium]